MIRQTRREKNEPRTQYSMLILKNQIIILIIIQTLKILQDHYKITKTLRNINFSLRLFNKIPS